MTASCKNAFAIIDAIRDDPNSRTQGVDAFSLALIRSERQIRRLFTNLVFQASAFEHKDIDGLKNTLTSRRHLYFRHFKMAFEELVGIPISDLVANYDRFSKQLEVAAGHRNKLFHGQLTGNSLTTSCLLSLEDDIRAWCYSLADNAHESFGYDGFSGGTSFIKNGRQEISDAIDKKITSIETYDAFLERLEGRREKQRSKLAVW